MSQREYRDHNRELAALDAVALAVSQSLELEAILDVALSETVGVLKAQGGLIYLLDQASHTFNPVAHLGISPGVLQEVSGFRVGQGLSGRAAEQGEVLIVGDISADPRNISPAAAREGWRSYASVPIKCRERVLGVMSLVSRQAGHFRSDHVAILTCMGRQIGIAIDNARLYKEARRELAEREQAEREIEQRTAQLEVLLNEVNHRVKNNLTIIMGILSLEMKRTETGSSQLQTILRDLQDRIRGLATVHDMLHDTGWTPIPLGELADRVIRAALSGSPICRWIDVQVTLPAEPLSVTPQQATGLGLVINELTTNSLKHAFLDRNRGRIEVQITSDRDNGSIVNLQYRDDGPGWPDDVMRGEREGVGLHIVRMTVRSPLRGQLALENNGGAIANITFKLAPTE